MFPPWRTTQQDLVIYFIKCSEILYADCDKQTEGVQNRQEKEQAIYLNQYFDLIKYFLICQYIIVEDALWVVTELPAGYVF